MGGKGQRRREKNWLAAHGGNSRLPPPPKPSELDVLPSKLRRLMELRNSSFIPQGLEQDARYTKHQSKENKGRDSAEKKSNSKDVLTSAGSSSKEEDSKKSELAKGKDSIEKTTVDDTRTRKRKSSVQDLRFQDLVQNAAPLRKKDRKKEYLKARKKKNKKSNTDNATDFPGREQIKFGDVVKAPPKLSFPKAQKNAVDASAERVRLQAVEVYRRKRGWEDRLGVRLPDLSETQTI